MNVTRRMRGAYDALKPTVKLARSAAVALPVFVVGVGVLSACASDDEAHTYTPYKFQESKDAPAQTTDRAHTGAQMGSVESCNYAYVDDPKNPGKQILHMYNCSPSQSERLGAFLAAAQIMSGAGSIGSVPGSFMWGLAAVRQKTTLQGGTGQGGTGGQQYNEFVVRGNGNTFQGFLGNSGP